MERDLPAGLSDQQRSVLLEFFKGHISAGQLTQRLGIQPPQPTRDLEPEQGSHMLAPQLELPRERATRSAKWLRRRLAA